MERSEGGGLGLWVSRRFWSTYRNSGPVVRALDSLLESLATGQRGLNVGAGERRAHPALIAIDVARSSAIDCVADARRLPFQDRAFSVVLSQETLEHVADPFMAVREMGRVLKHTGRLLLQTPFVLGYHPNPEDYWRFTAAGVRGLFEQAGLKCERVEPAYGAGTGLHRILVEFGAGLAGRVFGPAYRPAKGFLAIVLFPLKWLDGWLSKSGPSDRIAGGFLGIGTKPA
ncbi:MAG TPA: methyltransferase domain-containing protein [Anaerolineales bacterium]